MAVRWVDFDNEERKLSKQEIEKLTKDATQKTKRGSVTSKQTP